MKGERRQGRQRKRLEDNIREWTGLAFAKSQRAVENGKMEETGSEIICSAPTTLAVKGQMREIFMSVYIVALGNTLNVHSRQVLYLLCSSVCCCFLDAKSWGKFLSVNQYSTQLSPYRKACAISSLNKLTRYVGITEWIFGATFSFMRLYCGVVCGAKAPQVCSNCL